MQAHTHGLGDAVAVQGGATVGVLRDGGSITRATQSTGSGTTNMNPYSTHNFLIKV